MKTIESANNALALDRLEKSLFEMSDVFRKHREYIRTKHKISSLEMEIIQLVILDGMKKMKRQIIKIRGQMHRLKEIIHNNKKEIDSNLNEASAAKKSEQKAQVILKSRTAGRLKESNLKLNDLYV